MTIYFDDVVGEDADALLALFAHSEVRPVTARLIWSLLLDLPLTPAALCDFGIASADHYRALRAVVQVEDEAELLSRAEALDRALGNGPALTALVQKYAPEYQALTFEPSGELFTRQECLDPEGSRSE